jgi:hypothetical protein
VKTKVLRLWRTHQLAQQFVAITCAILLVTSGNQALFGQQAPQTQQPQDNVKIPADQLDAVVAPIALYPDPLLSQTLVASTYPLEIIQLQQWLEKNPGLKDQALVDAVSKQPWDPSIKAMAALPDLVKRLSNDIQWTTDLGNAFLAQESDVMNAVQRMRAKAQNNGTLKSDEHQKVETAVENNQSVIEVQQADPNVVYVPSYNPVAVYGPAVYPYPSIYYPPYYGTGAAIATGAIAFGSAIALGAFWGGGWGWGAGWGHGSINVNNNNFFNRNNAFNRNNFNRTGSNAWRHNPAHRGGTPYANRATANRFGGNTRGNMAGRRGGAQQQIARQKGSLGSAANRRAAGGGTMGNRNIGGGNRIGGANRGVGNRSLGAGSNRNAFAGRSGGFNRSGGSAMRSRGGGGGRSFAGGGRGGGGRGGGGRGGGGRGGGGRGGGGRR